MTTRESLKTTAKQRARLEQLMDSQVRVVGWSNKHKGPILRFPTGAQKALTRDGGLTGV